MRQMLIASLLLFVLPADAASVRLVAAESVYADLARQIAPLGTGVTAILDNPDADPHLFEASPSVARALANAAIVIENGAGYDPWMAKLIAATGGRTSHAVPQAVPRAVIDVGALVQAAPDGNPHLWYDPRAVQGVCAAIARSLRAADPEDAPEIGRRLALVETSLAALRARIGQMRARYAGAPVTATEPVFGLMLAALGLDDRNQGFQRAIMNDTEPSPAQIAAMESDLRLRRVRVLIRNGQTDDDTTRRLTALARAAGLPVVAVSETEPPGLRYQDWVGGQLDALQRALDQAP